MRTLLLGLAALSLAACTAAGGGGVQSPGTAAAVVTAATTPVCEQSIVALKASYGAEALYNAPAFAYRSADRRGLLKGALRERVRGLLLTLGRLLKEERAACDAATITDKVAAMRAIRDEVAPLIPR